MLAPMLINPPKRSSSGDGYESGHIRIHNGTLDDIPNGWVLCDGDNGTPNLVDRVPVGAGGAYAPKQQFGADSRTPTVSVANKTLAVTNLPSMRFSLGVGSNKGTLGGWSAGQGGRLPFGEGTAQYMSTELFTQYLGGGVAHNHTANVSAVDTRQKSTAVIYIMKL